jgi:hypothetical protein
VRNEEVSQRVKKESNIVHTIKKRRVTGHVLHRDCLTQHIIKGKIEGGTEMTGERGRRRKQLLDDQKYCRAGPSSVKRGQ